MAVYYGFNCRCGAEYDLEPSHAERIGVLRCRSCGRFIQTASSRPSANDESTNAPPFTDSWPTSRPIESAGEPESLLERWRKSNIPGEGKQRELALSCDGFDEQKFVVTFSEAYLDEGRHAVPVISESFTNYKEALKFYLKLARSYAPETVIEKVKRHLEHF